MTKLEAGQTWSNGRGKRYRIVSIDGKYFISVHGNRGPYSMYRSSFERWISRTGATLQETKP
jgi:hypothetical protein